MKATTREQLLVKDFLFTMRQLSEDSDPNTSPRTTFPHLWPYQLQRTQSTLRSTVSPQGVFSTHLARVRPYRPVSTNYETESDDSDPDVPRVIPAQKGGPASISGEFMVQTFERNFYHRSHFQSEAVPTSFRMPLVNPNVERTRPCRVGNATRGRGFGKIDKISALMVAQIAEQVEEHQRTQRKKGNEWGPLRDDGGDSSERERDKEKKEEGKDRQLNGGARGRGTKHSCSPEALETSTKSAEQNGAKKRMAIPTTPENGEMITSGSSNSNCISSTKTVRSPERNQKGTTAVARRARRNPRKSVRYVDDDNDEKASSGLPTPSSSSETSPVPTCSSNPLSLTSPRSKKKARPGVCLQCGTTETSQWRTYHKMPGGNVCNSCGMFAKKLESLYGAEEAWAIMQRKKRNRTASVRSMGALD